MKYMNSRHYGQSLIFGKRARFMAEPSGDAGADGDNPIDSTGGAGASSDDDGAPDDESLDDLKAQLAKAKADYQRLKIQNDNNSRQAKQLKDQLRSKQTAEEQKQEEQAEREAEFEALKKEVRQTKYSKRLVGMGMTENDADELASIIPEMEDHDAFFDAIGKFVESVRKTAGDAAVQKLLKDRPDINAGGGDSDKSDPAMIFAKQFVEGRKSSAHGVVNDNILKNYL